jgi:transcriptional regulator GlxA family with amidase domain
MPWTRVTAAAADQFRVAFPAVELDPEVLYVDSGQIVTSAGATAGVDMCLHLVSRDYGAAVAADASRLAVAPLYRDGGQAQFILRDNPRPVGGCLAQLLGWVEENAHRDLSLDDIASHAAMSTRTLNRRFHDQTGQTPMQWLNTVRIRQAQELLATTDYGIDRIAHQVGFTSPANFRAQFKRISGLAPQAYRGNFRDSKH